MNRMNWLFVLTSLSVVLVTVERSSFTTRILLQPHDFIRLHELVQMSVLVLFTVVVPTLLLREITDRFASLRQPRTTWLLVVFIVGLYFYATGNGVHELASFTLNTYCDVNDTAGNLCGGLFVNDFYTGNVMFFVGGFLMTASLILIEKRSPTDAFQDNGFVLLVINAVIYSLTVLAYAGFDKAPVGLIYSLAMLVFVAAIFLPVRRQYRQYPFTTYNAIVYSLGAVASLLVRVL